MGEQVGALRVGGVSRLSTWLGRVGPIGPHGRRYWAVAAAGLPPVHFHDLRHTGNTLTATAGANPRELMARMGHASPRAALIYLHSTDACQRQIAGAVGDLARQRATTGTTGMVRTKTGKRSLKERPTDLG